MQPSAHDVGPGPYRSPTAYGFSTAGPTVADMLADLMARGAKVIVCRLCIKMQGIDPQSLVEGAMLGNPELVSEYLFDPSYQVISW